MSDWVQIGLSTAVPVLAALIAFVSVRRLNNSTARKNDADTRRDDFEALLGPMREEIAAQRERVTAVEHNNQALTTDLARERMDSEALIADLIDLRNWVIEQFPDKTPPRLSPRVQARLARLQN